MRSLQNTKYSINEKLEKSSINLFSQKSNVSSEVLDDAQGRNVDLERDFKQVGEAGTVGEENNVMDMDGSESSDQDKAIPEDANTDSETSGSDEGDDVTESKAIHGDLFKEHVEFHGGRLRRRAVFGNDVDQNDLKVGLKFGHYLSVLS